MGIAEDVRNYSASIVRMSNRTMFECSNVRMFGELGGWGLGGWEVEVEKVGGGGEWGKCSNVRMFE